MRSTLELLSEYAGYHRDPRNIATHGLGVPLIVFALGDLLARPRLALGGLALTPAWVAFGFAAAWYLSRNLMLGLAVSAGVGVMLLLGQHVSEAGIASWLGWGLSTLALGWAFQLLGHWYEGRKPAFIDDLTSLLVGPMFVVAEWLFALGWNRPLQAAIEQRAGPTRLRDLAHPA